MPSGPAAGGQGFTLYGSNFQSLPTVEFGEAGAWHTASGCTMVNPYTVHCSATPPEGAGSPPTWVSS